MSITIFPRVFLMTLCLTGCASSGTNEYGSEWYFDSTTFIAWDAKAGLEETSIDELRILAKRGIERAQLALATVKMPSITEGYAWSSVLAHRRNDIDNVLLYARLQDELTHVEQQKGDLLAREFLFEIESFEQEYIFQDQMKFWREHSQLSEPVESRLREYALSDEVGELIGCYDKGQDVQLPLSSWAPNARALIFLVFHPHLNSILDMPEEIPYRGPSVHKYTNTDEREHLYCDARFYDYYFDPRSRLRYDGYGGMFNPEVWGFEASEFSTEIAPPNILYNELTVILDSALSVLHAKFIEVNPEAPALSFRVKTKIIESKYLYAEVDTKGEIRLSNSLVYLAIHRALESALHHYYPALTSANFNEQLWWRLVEARREVYEELEKELSFLFYHELAHIYLNQGLMDPHKSEIAADCVAHETSKRVGKGDYIGVVDTIFEVSDGHYFWGDAVEDISFIDQYNSSQSFNERTRLYSNAKVLSIEELTLQCEFPNLESAGYFDVKRLGITKLNVKN